MRRAYGCIQPSSSDEPERGGSGGPFNLTETTMTKTFQQLLAAGAAIALLGTAACTTLEASTGYGDGTSAPSAQGDDILQKMAADSQGG
jgi:hypothetical protein